MTGQTAVPVLELGGAIIFDSTRIIEAIEKAYPDPPLYPAGREARERALELETYFDEELGPYIRQWGYFMLLPYSSAVTSLFTSQAGLGKRLFMRAIFPLVRPVMIRKMKVYPAEAGAARDKTIAAMDRIAREVGPSGLPGRRRFHGCRSDRGRIAVAAGDAEGIKQTVSRRNAGANGGGAGAARGASGVKMGGRHLRQASRQIGGARGRDGHHSRLLKK